MGLGRLLRVGTMWTKLCRVAKPAGPGHLSVDGLGRAALAALYTEDAVLVNDTGPVYGRQAIEKYYADMFQTLHYFSHDTTYDPTSPHPIGTDGGAVWENGERTSALKPRRKSFRDRSQLH